MQARERERALEQGQVRQALRPDLEACLFLGVVPVNGIELLTFALRMRAR